MRAQKGLHNMKKLLAVIACIMLVSCMTAPAFADGPTDAITPADAGHMFMDEVIVSTIDIIGTLLKTALTICGAWLLAKLSQSVKTKTIKSAMETVIDVACQTVGELKQKYSDAWKAANADGKLTDEEVDELKHLLVSVTLSKLAQPIVALLRAAKVDLEALILGAGEDLINSMHTIKADM